MISPRIRPQAGEWTPRSGCRSGGACGWSGISRRAASVPESVLRLLAGLLQVGLGLLALALTGPGGVVGRLPRGFFGLAFHLLGGVTSLVSSSHVNLPLDLRWRLRPPVSAVPTRQEHMRADCWLSASSAAEVRLVSCPAKVATFDPYRSDRSGPGLR